MSLNLFLKGLVIGFSVAAPVGPIGILCIRRTINEGRLAGLFSGLGAASADTIFGFIAAFGLTFIANLLVEQVNIINLLGGLFLVYLGIKFMLSKPAEKPADLNGATLWKAYGSTLIYTLTNPMTILAFTAIFAGAGVASKSGNYGQSLLIVVGVFIGSALWWLTLSSIFSVLRERFRPSWLVWINRVAGIVILIFGFIRLASLA